MDAFKVTAKSLFGVFLCLLSITGCVTPKTLVTPTASPLTPVTLQLQWVTQAQFAGYYVALDKGWYAEEDIDLTIEPGGPDIIAVNSVVSGQSDFGTVLLPDLAVAVQDDKPVVAFAQIQQQNGLLLIAHKDSGIVGPQDFEGKRVGVWFEGWEAQFNSLMTQVGLSSDDFELVAQGYSMDAFLAGELDVASAMIYNEYHQVLEQGITAEELNVINYADYGLEFPGDVLFTSQQMITENQDLCVRMLRASLRGWRYAVDNPEEAVQIVLKYDESGVQTQVHQLSMMEEIVKLVVTQEQELGHIDQEDVQRMIGILVAYDVLDEIIESEMVYTDEIWEKTQISLTP